jgi:DNA-binding CsgD family transcriptional regulator
MGNHKEHTDPETGLTLREQQVVCHIAAGKTNHETAKAIRCNVKTYDTHRAHVLKKLKLRHSVDVARWAYRMGWVDLEGNILKILPDE